MNPTPYLDVAKLGIGSGDRPTLRNVKNVKNVKIAIPMKTIAIKKTLNHQEKLPVHNVIAPPHIPLSNNNSRLNVQVPNVFQSSKPIVTQLVTRDEVEKAKLNREKHQEDRKLKLDIFLKGEAEKNQQVKKQIDELYLYTEIHL